MDRALGTRPVFTILLLVAGFAAGVRETWTLIRRATSENDRKNS
jgi:F0F1-type ATP synthase assembly protein I